MSGYRLRDEFADMDAEKRFLKYKPSRAGKPGCVSGLVLQGLKKRTNARRSARNVRHTIAGATMVSSEGACAAYFKFNPGYRMTNDQALPMDSEGWTCRCLCATTLPSS